MGWKYEEGKHREKYRKAQFHLQNPWIKTVCSLLVEDVDLEDQFKPRRLT